MQQPEFEDTPSLSEVAPQAPVLGPRDDMVRTIVQNLRVIFGSIQAHSHWIEQQCGVSAVQLWALRELKNAPGLKVTELALVLSVHPSNCSSMVDKLRKKGLVRKQRTGPDQRVVRLHITAKGQELLDSAPAPVQGSLVGALESLSDDALRDLERSLDSVTSRLKVRDPMAALQPMSGT